MFVTRFEIGAVKGRLKTTQPIKENNSCIAHVYDWMEADTTDSIITWSRNMAALIVLPLTKNKGARIKSKKQ